MPGTLPHHLRRLVAHARVDHVVDVGAHSGDFGILMRGIGYDGPITSYDPAPDPQLIERAESDRAWRVRRVACGERDGEATLYRFGEAHAFNSLSLPTTLNATRFGKCLSDIDHREVLIVRLDDEELLGERFLLKTDAQGGDMAAVRGAGALLSRVVVLQMELAVQPLYESSTLIGDAIGELAELGFIATGFFPVARDLDGFRLIECDCTFVRSGAL